MVTVHEPRWSESPRLSVAFVNEAADDWIVTVRGELNTDSTIALQSQFDQLLNTQCGSVTLDLDELNSVDSVGTNVLLELRDIVSSRGGSLRVKGPGTVITRRIQSALRYGYVRP